MKTFITLKRSSGLFKIVMRVASNQIKERTMMMMPMGMQYRVQETIWLSSSTQPLILPMPSCISSTTFTKSNDCTIHFHKFGSKKSEKNQVPLLMRQSRYGAVLSPHQGKIYCWASSPADFIQNYFLQKSMFAKKRRRYFWHKNIIFSTFLFI